MKKILSSLIITLAMGLLIAYPSSALTCDDISNGGRRCVASSILGKYYDKNGNEVSSDSGGDTVHCKCDDGKGSSIRETLELIVEIMGIGVGLLGVVGISITGIQYLTAGGDEAKATKAKRRIIEIVIGLAIYAVLYAIINFLLPGSA